LGVVVPVVVGVPSALAANQTPEVVQVEFEVSLRAMAAALAPWTAKSSAATMHDKT